MTEEEFLKSYNPDKYPKPSLTADICIFAHSDVTEILLVKRGGHPYIGKWALPGGFANKNEPIEKTASRELKEETGIVFIQKLVMMPKKQNGSLLSMKHI